MQSAPQDPETLWESLLSRQPEQVRAAFNSLDPGGQKLVLEHLQRMTGEDGWHPEQRLSAQAALDALR
jgi:hypothetical protein